jgi:hypothetical protein
MEDYAYVRGVTPVGKKQMRRGMLRREKFLPAVAKRRN